MFCFVLFLFFFGGGVGGGFKWSVNKTSIYWMCRNYPCLQQWQSVAQGQFNVETISGIDPVEWIHRNKQWIGQKHSDLILIELKYLNIQQWYGRYVSLIWDRSRGTLKHSEWYFFVTTCLAFPFLWTNHKQ